MWIQETEINSGRTFNKLVKVIIETISRQAIYWQGTGCLGNTSILKKDAK